MAKQKFYVVWKGRKSGVFPSWEECAAQVNGFAGAEYKAFERREDAEAAFRGTYADYKGRHIPNLSAEALSVMKQPVADSFCVDASCIGNPGPMEYHCVHTTTRQEIFQQGPFENGTNNIGEFLALVDALALLERRGWTQPVYSDSETAMTWVRHKKCKTKLAHEKKNVPIFERIAHAEDWLRKHTYETQILKWETQAWGEIPADYGRK